MKIIEINNIVGHLGKNKVENHSLVNEMGPDDTWFHLENSPGPHLVVKSSTLTKNQVYRFALEVKKNSIKNKKNCVYVMYAQGKHVTPTLEIGKVNVEKYKVIKV